MTAMGQFKVTVTLHPQKYGAARTVEALVDTGAGYSMFPRPLLEALGCQAIRSQRVVLTDGRMEEWSLSQVDVEYEGRRAPTPVLMGPPDSPVLLGATTLEELGLGVDPLNRRLIPVDIRLYLASVNGTQAAGATARRTASPGLRRSDGGAITRRMTSLPSTRT